MLIARLKTYSLLEKELATSLNKFELVRVREVSAGSPQWSCQTSPVDGTETRQAVGKPGTPGSSWTPALLRNPDTSR